MRYSDRNKTQHDTNQHDRGFLNERTPMGNPGQPGYGSTPDPASSKSKNGIPRNPKQKNSGPMKSAPFPKNRDRY
jgi:hypothetical protein